MKKFFHRFKPQPLIPLIIIIFFFLPPLISGKIPIPGDLILGLYHPWRDISFDGFSPEHFPAKNPLIVDPVVQTYPWKSLIIENLKSKNLPFWNPYSFSGQPLLANVQSSAFSILNILFFVFPFKIAWALYIILPPIISSIFMYLLLRELKLSKIASSFGAFILPFTGYFITWLEWGNMIATAMWLPVLLLSIKKTFSRITIKWFLFIVLVTSQVLLAGFWQTAFYVYLATFLYLLFTYLKEKRLSPLLWVIFALLIGILVASPQILPTLEFINYSSRDVDLGYFKGRQDWFLPYQNLIQLIAPDYFGNPSTYNYWGVWNYLEFSSFIGIIPLCLALFSLKNVNNESKYFIFLGTISLLLALKNPISQLPYTLDLPLLSTMQPSRIIFLLVFSFAALSAFGLEKFINAKPSKKLLILPLTILCLLITVLVLTFLFKDIFPQLNGQNTQNIAMRNLVLPILTAISLIVIFIFKVLNLSPKIVIAAIVLVTVFELFRFGYKFNSFSKFSWIFPQTETISFLQNQPRPFRVMILDRRIFEGNTSSVYHLEQVGGYDPLFLKDYAKLVSSWDSNRVSEPGSYNRIVFPKNYESQIADFLNIQFILSLDEINNQEFVKVFEEGKTKVYKNLNFIPRAIFVDEVIKVGGQDEALSLMLNKSLNFAKQSVSTDFGFNNNNSNSTVKFERYDDQSFSLSSSTEKQSPLVVSNIFYPGWEASIDGKKTPIYKVNFMFQSILVPQGSHKVEFKFRPRSFYNGVYLSVFGIILTLTSCYLLWRRKFQ